MGDPISKGYLLTAIIPVIIITLWGLLYIVNPYKYEKSYYLFFGVYGVVNTFVYFLAIQKLFYINLQVTSKWLFLVGLLLFLGLVIGINLFNIRALYSGTYYNLQQKDSISINWFAVGGIGAVFGYLLMAIFYTESATMLIMIICIILLSLPISFFSTNIHKYFYIRKHIDDVKQIYPEFGLPKAEREEKKKEGQKMILSLSYR